MTPRERATRLAAILGLPDEVTFAKYRGHGERSTRRNYRTATLGPHRADGATDDEAMLYLANRLEAVAQEEVASVAQNAAWWRDWTARKRARAADLRRQADEEDAEVDRLSAEVDARAAGAEKIAAAVTAYLTEREPLDDE